MLNKIGTLVVLCAFLVVQAVVGCRVQSGSPLSVTNVNGVAATGTPVVGSVTLLDSSSPAKQVTTATASDGSFAFRGAGLTPPYVVRANWVDGSGPQQLFAFADDNGTTNINPLTNAIFASATGGQDQSQLTSNIGAAAMQAAKSRHPQEKSKLLVQLAKLFEKYGVVQDPENDNYEADHRGLDAMFDDVTITVKDGMVYVTNKKTNKPIFIGPVNNLEAGTFYPENMPGGSGTTPPDGAALYGQNCQSCHGPLSTSSKTGVTAAAIHAAITNNTGGMGALSALTALEVQAIADALAVMSTPPAPLDGATLYAQSCSSCHGPLATSSKAGASAVRIQTAITNNTGGMGTLSGLTSAEIQLIATALAQSTPPSPPDGAALYTAKCAGCHGPLASSSKTGRTSAQIQSAITGNTGGMGSLSGLTPAEIDAIAAALSPAAPAACTYTYSAWGTCQADGTQTRTVATSTPAGCTGTPVLSQSCTYVPPTPASCTYTYSAWGACQPDGTQTRAVATSTPAGCTGTPALTQTCTYTPPAPVCGSCHAIPPATGRHDRHVTQLGFSCSICHGTGYSSTTVNAATHANGTKDIVSSLNWNAATSTCGSPGCHASRVW